MTKIKLNENTYLCAAESPDPYKELSVYIEKDGMVWQDLAVVREKYHYDNDNVVGEGKYEVFVYADESNEDFTHKFVIEEYKETENA